jgi:hypothetical protein
VLGAVSPDVSVAKTPFKCRTIVRVLRCVLPNDAIFESPSGLLVHCEFFQTLLERLGVDVRRDVRAREGVKLASSSSLHEWRPESWSGLCHTARYCTRSKHENV